MPFNAGHQTRERLKERIEKDVFVRGTSSHMVVFGEYAPHARWIFDFRKILLEADVLSDISQLFYAQCSERHLCIGGMEAAAIPLVAGLVYAGHHEYKRDVQGFFIRKGRKKDGLLKIIEGSISREKPIVLVDDIINTGASLVKQVKILEQDGYTVSRIWTLLRFRDESFYAYLRKRGIGVESLFSLDDFSQTLGIHNLVTQKAPLKEHFEIVWRFASPSPAYEYVLPKSDPVLDEVRVYIGSDIGTLWALNQHDGSVAWSFATGSNASKGIFSSPALLDGMVLFGGYDGNMYALDAATGTPLWIARIADWIGSSPAIATDLGFVFIGSEHGLWRKRGGITALDITTGRQRWSYSRMPNFTHSSPLYIAQHRQVVIGSNDGAAYLFDAKTGALAWRFETGTPSATELNSGFSAHDIKESFVYDAAHDRIIFGNLRGLLCFVDRKSGHTAHIFEAEYGFFSTPLIYNDTVLASSLDKNLYCIDLSTFKEKWRWNAGARIFATPVIIDGLIYIGSNSGRMSVINPHTGREEAFLQLTERITNKVAHNPATKCFFVATQANELYCVERKST